MKIEILDEALEDLADGFHFYEIQSPGLGDYFPDSLYADIDSLRIYAGIHSVQFGYHRVLAKRFPFIVYYHIVGDVVKVDAVLDCRRDPAWIRDRLT